MTDIRHPVNGRLLVHHEAQLAQSNDLCALCALDKDCQQIFMRQDPPCLPDSVLKYADGAPEASRCPDCGVTPGNGPTSCECEVTS